MREKKKIDLKDYLIEIKRGNHIGNIFFFKENISLRKLGINLFVVFYEDLKWGASFI